MRLGLHVQGAYDAAERYIRAVRPPVVKFLDRAPAHLVDLVHSYGGLTILRLYTEDQGLGRYDEYLEDLERLARGSAVKAIEVSYNEAHQVGGELAAKAKADIRGMQMAERIGKRAVIGSFSVGMPDLPEGDHGAEWRLYAPALRHAAEHGHYLGLHQYGGGTRGVKFAPLWYALRHRLVIAWAKGERLPMPEIVITEAGIDHLERADMITRGWQAMPEGYDYPADMVWLCQALADDPQVVGVVDFGFGSTDPQWHPFDLSREPGTLDRMIQEMSALPGGPKPPAPTPPKEEPMADLHQMLGATLGARYQDLRGQLPTRPNGPNGDFPTRALKSIDTIAIHHTAGPRAQSWESIASFHVTAASHQWAGIGYHLGIRQGKLAYLGGIERARACVKDLNPRVICLVLTGDYEAGAVDAVDAALLRDTVAVLQRWAVATLGRSLAIKGHGELPGQATLCPGRHLSPIVRQLAAGTVLTPEPTAIRLDKVVWGIQEGRRILEERGHRAESVFVGEHYEADAIRRRDSR